MIRRGFSRKFKNKNKTYENISVCEEWLIFSNFKSWMEKQDWKGKELDKDLIINGNSLYSPETCCFISRLLNLVIKDKQHGGCLLGVTYKQKSKDMINELRKPYVSRVSYYNFDKGIVERKHLGNFSTEIQAHLAWQKEKVKILNLILERQQIHEESQLKIISAVKRIISNIQRDIELGRPTNEIN